MTDTEGNREIKKILYAAILPTFFMLICWAVFAIEFFLNLNLAEYGLKPRNISQWFGIFTMPFLHGDFSHIIGNSVSFVVLGTMLFYFYYEKAIEVFILSYFFSGFFTWLIGMHGIHIGASAMIYAFAAYIFTVGVKSKNVQSMAVSLIVIFLYGSMIWGLYPQNTGISWEGHLSGAVSGVALAFIYPIHKSNDFSIEEDDDENNTFDDFDSSIDDSDITIKYHYKKTT